MPLPTPEDLKQGHLSFMGVPPSSRQGSLYDQFPSCRGPSHSNFDPELFEAVIVMGLVQTIAGKVYLFVPSRMEKEAILAIRELVDRIFARIKERQAVNQAKAMGKAFKALMLGHKFLQMEKAPERWVTFGFSKQDLVPAWFSEALMDVLP